VKDHCFISFVCPLLALMAICSPN
jgi:hypothetical protein